MSVKYGLSKSILIQAGADARQKLHENEINLSKYNHMIRNFLTGDGNLIYKAYFDNVLKINCTNDFDRELEFLSFASIIVQSLKELKDDRAKAYSDAIGEVTDIIDSIFIP